MKGKQHGRSFLSVWNKRVLCATARHASHVRKRPLVQFAVSVFFFCFVLFCFVFFCFFCRLLNLKRKRMGFTQERVFLYPASRLYR